MSSGFGEGDVMTLTKRLVVVVVMTVPMARAIDAHAAVLRFADTLVSFAQGPAAQPGFQEPAAAIGPPSVGHTPSAPENTDPATGAPNVFSLGQRGSIVLGFDRPVFDQPSSPRNPYGYDLLVWGNTLQGGQAITPEFEFGRFNEPGMVEVAAADAAGEPIEWFLILPRIFYDSVQYEPGRPAPVPRDILPADLLPPVLGGFGEFIASGDVSISASRIDGLADAVPMQGSVLAAVLASGDPADIELDDPATFAIEGLGGAGIDLSRAVRQAEPGVPMLVDGRFEFVVLDHIDLVRVTDVHAGDLNPGALGAVTTEVDGVIVLPDLRGCPEPFADADRDGDVDQTDFARWQACYTGDGGVISALDCVCFDRDGDGDIDGMDDDGESDLAAFRQCAAASGPGVPADADCDGS